MGLKHLVFLTALVALQSSLARAFSEEDFYGDENEEVRINLPRELKSSGGRSSGGKSKSSSSSSSSYGGYGGYYSSTRSNTKSSHEKCLEEAEELDYFSQ